MERPRPTAILVFAILHIVGAAFGLFGACTSGIVLATAGTSPPATTRPSPAAAPKGGPGSPPPMPQPPSASQIMAFYRERIPSYTFFTVGALLVGVLLDAMLLAGGVGLLKMQPWARTLSLVYAGLSIVFHILSFAYQLAVVLPATHEFYANYASSGPWAGMGQIMEVASDVGVFASQFVILYPIVVIVFMLRRATVMAFRGEVPPDAAEVLDAEDPWHRPSPGDAITR